MKHLLQLTTIFFTTVFFAQDYQFLGSYDAMGTPDYLVESDVVTQATLNLVGNSLPEGYPVPVYNPQYISAGYDTDLILDDDAEVWVTFVQEGAGYKNVLGFYTYQAGNPPAAIPQPEDITIVFPNVSGLNSGGGLLAGDKVKIGDFEAGTGIGWVLLANGWNNTVTSGQWQVFSNPDYNPEADENLRPHNVLLADPENQRVILGFEDIRRDYASCDNDFNDAVFYITASPYTAIRVGNYADVSMAADVSSGNDGGLESNGDLAALIAKRNFDRTKTNSFLNRKSVQSQFVMASVATKSSQQSIASLFPDTGMFGNETAYVSSPDDLIEITNATEIFSIDYYSDSERVAAALATRTSGAVYDHSKVICDRLNGSSLEDVRTIILQGHTIIMVKLKRANGTVEYALSFSVAQTETQNILHSYWNIAQYPENDYINFQIWGANMGQVCSVANTVLSELEQENPVTDINIEDRIPSVFVKQGTYKNGMLTLDIVNKSQASTLTVQGNKKATELSEIENFTENIALTPAFYQTIQVATGGIFDIGISVSANTSVREDGMYLADGPWGIDYDEAEADITGFEINNFTNSQTNTSSSSYIIERDATVTGNVYGTVNLFRNILAGDLTLGTLEYEAVTFELQSSHAVEVVLVTEGLSNWNNRLRYQLPASGSSNMYSIALNSFSNLNGENYLDERIKGFVFSVIGNYSSFEPFELSVSSVELGTQVLRSENFEGTTAAKMFNYPNPFYGSTTVVLPIETQKAKVELIDMTGRIVSSNWYNDFSGNEIHIDAEGLPKGVYFIQVTSAENKTYTTRCVIQ